MKKGDMMSYSFSKLCYDRAVIDSQELVCRSGHVDIVVLALCCGVKSPYLTKNPHHWSHS